MVFDGIQNTTFLPQKASLKPIISMKSTATILAILNLKGGVGKTTTAVHLAVSLSRHARVLLIDLDLQASSSLYMGLSRYHLQPSAAEWLYDEAPFGRVLRHTAFDGLDLVPASSNLRNFEAIVSQSPAYTNRLKQALKPVSLLYDYIIIDCPPAFSLLSVNALVAANYFIAPCPPQYLAYEATKDLFSSVKEIQEYYRIPVAENLGVLITMNKRFAVAKEMERMLQMEFGKQLFKTQIDASVKMEQAAKERLSIFDLAGKSVIANQYWALAEEVTARIREKEVSLDGSFMHPAEMRSTADLQRALARSSWELDRQKVQKRANKYQLAKEAKAKISFPDEEEATHSSWFGTFRKTITGKA